ncbi:MAG: hypothetical protein J3R72DRAFT_130561 [Linnemannia gamsii]|nr:MAG: hypothetical protein J3R72DRAFT_130561 [Linnemannia gamsii]
MRVKRAIGKLAAPINLDHLTTLHAKGDGFPQDFQQALECYLISRRRGHTHALICVGDLFLDGRDVTKDSSVAIGWYLKAAVLGDTRAQRKVEAFRLQGSRRCDHKGQQFGPHLALFFYKDSGPGNQHDKGHGAEFGTKCS